MQATNEPETFNHSQDSESESEGAGSNLAGSYAEERNRPSPTLNGGLFRDENNHAINFFIHNSVKKADTINKLASDIRQHGGRVVQSVKDALVVLVARDYPSRKLLQASYEAARHADLHRIYVKPTPFVMKCIQNNQVFLYEEEIKPMRGFPPGGRRNNFTQSDDEELCHYLSRITPAKGAGGRSGHNIYKQLVALAEVNPAHFSWARKHPYDSWRGRYKNNKAKMDAWIDEMVEENPPTHKQLWREDRRLNKQRRVRYIDISGSEEEAPEGDEENGEQGEGDDDEVQHVRDHVTKAVEKPRQNGRVQLQYQEPPSKRARIAPGRREASSSQKQKSAKGKERAVEEEEEFIEATLYTFDDEEEEGPDPSWRTLVPTHTQQGAPRSPNFWTQDTLAPSTSQNDNQAQFNPHGLPMSTAWPSPIPPPAAVLPSLADTSTRSAPALTTSPSNRRQSNNEAGPAPSFPEPKPTSLPAHPTNTIYQRPRMAARRPKNFMRRPEVDDSEPIRIIRPNTVQLPNVLSTQTRKTVKDEPVDDFEAEQRLLVASPVLRRLGESALEEETGIRNPGQKIYNGERATSMDTDDAETKQNLSNPSKASTSLDTDPSEILQRLQTQSINLRESSRLSLRASSVLASRTPQSNLQTPNRAPVTPGKLGPASDTSSQESFPRSGTKASAMKRQLQQNEKKMPYDPPGRTRAAMLAQQRRGYDS